MPNEIVDKNLERMNSKELGGMVNLLFRESVGGNAGTYKGYPCTGARFYFDKENGEIKYFGNLQEAPDHIRSQYASDIFRLAIDWRDGGTGKYRIVEPIPQDETLSQDVRKVLAETADEYNRKYGFDL